MNARYPHPSARKNHAAARPGPGDAARAAAAPAAPAGRACCCPAKAVVRVIMPPAPGRPGETDLLLCGHHYRASCRALDSSRATVHELPGTPGDVAAWIYADR